jgi:RNA exonuclease 1
MDKKTEFLAKRDSLFNSTVQDSSTQDHPLLKRLKLQVSSGELFQLTDHARLSKKGPFYAIQTLITWVLLEEGINPNWVFIRNRSHIKKAVFLILGKVNTDLWDTNLENSNLSFLKERRDDKYSVTMHCNQAVPSRNLWSMVFGTPLAKKNPNRGKGWPGYILSEKELKCNQFPDQDYDCCNGFVDTGSWETRSPEIYKDNILAIDCEMVETENGHELARLSIIDKDFELLYDQYCKPELEVKNFHFQYSGITQENIDNATKTLKDVQEDLKMFMDNQTIIVGHSLENDLFALKLIHKRIVDTSVLFSTRQGTKIALKQLSMNYLKYKIQCNDKSGHDPSEDARASLALAKYKIEIMDPLDLDNSENKNYDFLAKLAKKFKILVLDKEDRVKPLLNNTGIMYKEIQSTYFANQFDALQKYAKYFGELGNNSCPDLLFAKLDFFDKDHQVFTENGQIESDAGDTKLERNNSTEEKDELIKVRFHERAKAFDAQLKQFYGELPANTLVTVCSFSPYSYKELWEKYSEGFKENKKVMYKKLSNYNKNRHFFTTFLKA